ncbi:hypothetical protein ACI65C_006498 [Semiaphis heraclei]
MEFNSGEFTSPAVKQRQNKKCWVIATFPDSNDFSVISTNWVLQTVDGYGNSVVKCVWPPSTFHVTSDYLKECVEPADNWSTYRIKLYENGKEYGDFGKAWYKHVALSDQSASEVDQQKKKINSKTKDVGVTIKVLPPQLKMIKSSQTVMSEQNIVQAIGETSTEPQYTELSELNNVNSIPSSSRANELLSIPVSHHFNMSESISIQKIEIKQIPSVNPVDHLDRIQPEVIQTAKQNTIMELLNLIYKEQIRSRVKHDHLLSKLEQIEKAVNKIGMINKISTAIPDFDTTFMANWPMKNEQMFQNVSKCLLEDSFVSLVKKKRKELCQTTGRHLRIIIQAEQDRCNVHSQFRNFPATTVYYHGEYYVRSYNFTCPK